MGMDVHGRRPRSPEGEYFRANVSSWPALASMLTDLYPDYAAKVQYLWTNDGDGLDADDADKLGALMVRDERIPAYITAWNERADSYPMLECRWCSGTGTRTDDVGVRFGMVERGWCNGCDGAGKVKDYRAHMRMDPEHVREFCRFIAASGGFTID